MSHADAAPLAKTADRLGLTRALSAALARMRERRRKHDPGRVVRDLAEMLADSSDCLGALRAVRDQACAQRCLPGWMTIRLVSVRRAYHSARGRPETLIGVRASRPASRTS